MYDHMFPMQCSDLKREQMGYHNHKAYKYYIYTFQYQPLIDSIVFFVGPTA